MRKNISRLWSTLRRGRREKELQAEIDFHLQTLTDGYIQRGWSEKEARLAAKRDFGGWEQMKEVYREGRGFPLLESVRQDIKLAVRGLRKSPAFTIVAIVSLALGIGANTAIFSFVNTVLLKQLPVPEPKRLVTLSTWENGKQAYAVFSLNTIDQLAKRNISFDGLFGRFPAVVSFAANNTSQWLMGELVTGQYFQVLQAKPVIGRLLNDEDVRNAAGDPVCVLSYDTWQTRFGGDLQVAGRTVSLNGHAYRVLGVTERGFYGLELEHRIDLQIPATRVGDFMPSFAARTDMNWVTSLYWLSPMARLKPGLTISQAQGQLQNLYRQLQREASGGEDVGEHSILRLDDGSTGLEYMRSRFAKPITILMAVVALVLAVACVNLANLLLARSSARGKEFAVRLSLGSSRTRLIRQLLVESLLLAFCGGALGVVFSFWITNTLLAFLNGGQPSAYALRVAPDLRVFCFSFALTFCTAVLFGLAPAWQATRPNLLPSLKEEGRGASGQFQRALFRKSLVVAQIALSLVVLFAAGLLTRTLRSLQTVRLGFDKEKLIVLSVNPAASDHSATETASIYRQILQRASILPGVQAGSLSLHAPLRPMTIAHDLEVPPFPKQEMSKEIAFNYVSEGYFLTLNQPLLRGRDFSNADTKGTRPVAIVNQKFANHYFAGQSPIGQHLLQSGKKVEIVGVAANLHDGDLRSSVQETVYMPEQQAYTSSLTLLLRTRTDPKEVIPSLLGIIRNIDRRMPVFSARTLDAQVGAELSSERILSYLSGLFAALATLLTGVGLYGVMAYAVTRRTREIGVRFAIGAQRGDIARLFLHESLIVITAGVMVGVPLALASVTVLKSLLFGLTATDIPTLLLSAGVLLIAGLAATALPLRKAAYTDPMSALRYE